MFGHADKTYAIKVVSNTVKVWKPKKVDTEVKTIEEGKQSKDEADSTVRQIKGKDKATDNQKEANTQQSNSSNRFSILEAEIEGSEPSLSVEGESKEEGGNEEPRKARVVVAEVEDLMQTLKPKNKGQAGKVRKKQPGQSSSNSV